MASLRGAHITGQTNCKTIIFNTSGQALVVSSGLFENFVQGSIANYYITTTEKGTTGIFEATIPTISVLPVDIEYFMLDNTLGAVFSGGEVSLNSAGAVISYNGVALDLTKAIPTSNTAQTLGDCLNAARAQGFGKWVVSGTSLFLYANDGTTVIKTFALAPSASAPVSRTPV